MTNTASFTWKKVNPIIWFYSKKMKEERKELKASLRTRSRSGFYSVLCVFSLVSVQ